MRKKALLLCLIVCSVVAGVLIADPEPFEEAPTASPSDGPKSEVAVAITRLSYLDYTYQITRYDGQNVTRQFRANVSHSDDKIIEQTTVGPEYVEYYTSGGRWIEIGKGNWVYSGYTGYTDNMNPFIVDKFRASTPLSVNENDSYIVVRYGAESPNEMFHTEIGTSYNESMRNLSIYVNKSSGNVELIRFTVKQDEGWFRYRYEFEYGPVTVRRPAGIPPITLAEIINDLKNTYRDDDPPGWDTDS